MGAEKGKENMSPGVLINELHDLKQKLESQGMSAEVKQSFAELKKIFVASATAARESGNTNLSQVFVKDVSPLIKQLEGRVSEKKVETFPRSAKNKWSALAEQHQNVVKSNESMKGKSTEKAEEQKLESPKPSFRMGSGRSR